MEDRKYQTLAEYSKATGQDKHSLLVDYDIFCNIEQVDQKTITKVYKVEDLDFRLKSGSVATDAGCVLLNVNDGHKGKAPDLGTLESGQSLPIYGPRP